MAKITALDLEQHLSQAMSATDLSTEEVNIFKTATRELANNKDDTHVADQLKMRLSLLAAQQRLSTEGVALLSWLVKAYPRGGAQRGMGLTHL
ncbi:hypothetical protein [Lacticaseibacillus sp. GG6-2]